MSSFEERFASVGRAFDRAIERVRDRRPGRFERRRGVPTLREQARERFQHTREFFKEGEWRNISLVDERSRKRLIVLGCVLGLSLLVAAPWWIVRGVNSRATFEEVIDQERMRIRLELASKAASDNTMGSWGAGPGAGAKIESRHRWGPE